MKAVKGKVIVDDCGEVGYEAEAVDLDGDGQLEVMTQEFGFPGWLKILEARNHGFPDIEVLGPGTCFPVWR